MLLDQMSIVTGRNIPEKQNMKKEVTISWSKFKELHKMGWIDPSVVYNVYHDNSEKLEKS
jgi:hypothetical protein